MSAAVPLYYPNATNDPCATPNCREKRGYGLWGVFCSPCAEFLAKIREELDAETEGFKPGASGQRFADKHGRGSTCCAPHCFKPRDPVEAFCEDCRAEGFVEEAA